MTRADMRMAVAVAALLLGASGCRTTGGTGGVPGAVTSGSTATTSVPAGPSTVVTGSPPSAGTTAVAPSAPLSAGSCHARGSGLYALPDPACTPGATNPAVTPADIDRTICASGWTSTVRPSEAYTEPLKDEQMTAYGDTGSAGNFEEDHLIPLELGGSPTSPHNLWPEPGASPNPKDAVEGAAKQAVCAGRIGLTAAQQAIATNWVTFGEQLGVVRSPTPTPQVAGTAATCTASAAFSSEYGDWDVYVHSNQPGQTVEVSTSGGDTATYHTNGSGYADVYLHAPESAGGQQVTVTVGRATCTTTL